MVQFWLQAIYNLQVAPAAMLSNSARSSLRKVAQAACTSVSLSACAARFPRALSPEYLKYAARTVQLPHVWRRSTRCSNSSVTRGMQQCPGRPCLCLFWPSEGGSHTYTNSMLSVTLKSASGLDVRSLHGKAVRTCLSTGTPLVNPADISLTVSRTPRVSPANSSLTVSWLYLCIAGPDDDLNIKRPDASLTGDQHPN